MRALLDTHTVLWALGDDANLSPTARDILTDLSHELLVSAVSAWEVAVKVALGKLEAPEGFEQAVVEAGFTPMRIGYSECERLRTLPQHHRDPFDRMLVAQASILGVPLITRDPQIARYAVQTIW